MRRVWVTRAEPGAGRTAVALRALGFEPVVRPMLAIRAIPRAAPDLTGHAALAFTSSNGVEAFAALTTARDLPVFAVGDETARAALKAGFGAVRSAGGAIEDLARLIRAEATGPVLAPGAREPAGDLAALTGDIEVRTLAVYEAVETGAKAPDAFDAVLIHSPRGGRAVAAALGPDGGAGRLAVAISPAAAAPLAGAGFAAIRIARAPTGAAVLEALGNPGPGV